MAERPIISQAELELVEGGVRVVIFNDITAGKKPAEFVRILPNLPDALAFIQNNVLDPNKLITETARTGRE